MDKYEYKIKADEIKALIAQGEYQQAADIADSIDWRRVKSVMMLCTISDLYKINRRYEDSRDILLLAYDRHPGGRTIVYSLCELSIKLEDYVMAIEYYKEFVQIAPKDTGRYILQYKLYQAQDVSLEERIAVLEELKAKDYREKWAYELAYLYHRVGLATKCVEECDELILWFGEGKYVVKAMELKMLHQPLTPQQQEKYDNRFQPTAIYDNQEQTAESMDSQMDAQEYAQQTAQEQSAVQEAAEAVQPTDVLSAPTIRIPSEEIEIQVKTMDVGQYNTINLQKELAEGLREVLEGEKTQDEITRSIIAPMVEDDTDTLDTLQVEEVEEDSYIGEITREQMETEVFFGSTGEVGGSGLDEAVWQTQETLAGEEIYTEEIPAEEPEKETEETMEAEWFEDAVQVSDPAEESEEAEQTAESEGIEHIAEAEEEKEAVQPVEPEEIQSETVQPTESDDPTAVMVMEQMRMQNLGIEPPKEMAGVLSMESDGQISLVVPESEKIEKQITGQMSIEDILAEWERMKRENEEKRKEEVHQRVLRQTGPMFTAFEESIRDGLLEQLEQGAEPEDVIAEAEKISGEENDSVLEEAVEEIYEEEAVEEENVQEMSGEEEPAGDEEVEELVEIEESEEEQPEETEPAGEEEAEELVEIEESEEEQPEETEPAGDEEAEELVEIEESEEEQPEETEPAWEEEVEELVEIEESEEEQPEETESAGDEEAEELVEIEESTEEAEEQTDSEEPEEEGELPEVDMEEASEEEPRPMNREKAQVRALTKEEKELYGNFIQSRSSREKLIHAIDSISMASYTGNVVITGDEGMDTLTLAKNMIREVQMTDSNFSGKIAKISGHSLNQRDVVQTLDGLANGALIIQKASEMNKNTVDTLYKALQQEKYGLIVIMEDNRKAMNKFLGVYAKLAECFNARMDMEALSNDALVAFGKKYAREMEYSIDELGVLALHTRIAEMQTSDHAVTIMDVKEIMDEAIHHANRKTVGHFMDILLAKRYDEEDMIILRENDFI